MFLAFYLYVILDVFSRYAVGCTVQHRGSAEIAKTLIAQAAGSSIALTTG